MVDIGSNSVRLLQVLSATGDGPAGPRETHVVGLKRDATADGNLAASSLARLDARLATLGETVTDAALPETFVVGTSAVRDAPNRAEVARIVRERLHADLVVVSGEREAGLAYRGARLAHPRGPVGVLDVGGASTEIAIGETDTPSAAISVNVGGVRCNVGPVSEDPPAPGSVDSLRARIAELITAESARLPSCETVIGVAGTLTTLAAIDIGRYDADLVHGHVLTSDRLDEILGRLTTLTIEERRAIPGLEPDRAPVIVAGAAIVLGVLDAIGVAEVVVSERDLLDGVALGVLEGSFRIDGEIS